VAHIWRTVRRVVLRAELWNGNRERWKNLFARDPDQSVIVWAWRRHSVYQARYTAATTDPAWRHLTFVRIRSHKDAQQLLDRVSSTT